MTSYSQSVLSSAPYKKIQNITRSGFFDPNDPFMHYVGLRLRKLHHWWNTKGNQSVDWSRESKAISAEAYKQLPFIASTVVICKHSSSCHSSCQLRSHANIERACITFKTALMPPLISTALPLPVTHGDLSPTKDCYKVPAPFRHTLGSFSVLGHSVILQIVILRVIFPFRVKLKAFVLLALAFLVVVHVDCLTAFIRDLLRSPHAESDMRFIVGVTGMCRVSRMLVSNRIDLKRVYVLD